MTLTYAATSLINSFYFEKCYSGLNKQHELAMNCFSQVLVSLFNDEYKVVVFAEVT